MTQTILEYLERLVAFDTSDPKATVTSHHPIIAYVSGLLEDAGCAVTIDDLGGGSVNVLARRGEPSTFLNCHLDTVKPSEGWSRDPFALEVRDHRAIGLGACDIKGAAACLLHAVRTTTDPTAILFTTDEEGGSGRCVRHFVETIPPSPTIVVVAEPTMSMPVTQHRGFASFEIDFRGDAGHSSGRSATNQSAVHALVRWADAALALRDHDPELRDARLNIGMVTGGSASNVIAPSASLRFGFRPAPGPDAALVLQGMIERLKSLLPKTTSATWRDRFIAPPLTAGPESQAFLTGLGLEVASPVDFWTEAALFADGGLPAVVIGPGSIKQAHAADEYVEIDQLERCNAVYQRIIREGAQQPLMKGSSHAS